MSQDKVDLSSLIGRAHQQGLWLWCSYLDLWFSPEELEAENRQGRFRWGEINWELRDPQECITTLTKRLTDTENSLTNFRRRVGQEGTGKEQ